MRYNFFVILILCLFSVTGTSQNLFYRIDFTDKHNSPYSVSDPSQFLSQRSIARRAAQFISVDSTDLPVNPQYLDSLQSAGLEVWATSRWFNWAVVRTTDTALVNQVLSWSFVKSGDRVKRSRSVSTGTKEKSIKGMVSSGPLDYGSAFNQANMISADYLHAVGYRGEGMLVAVLDAGFADVDTMFVFDSLRNENRIAGTWDFVLNNSNVFGYNHHGTYVLSTMAANAPGTFIGTAPGASYLLLRTEDVSTETISEEYFWIAGAEFADSSGADIINSSLGYTRFDSTIWDHTYADMDGNTAPVTIGADMAAAKGILVVASAGNEGASSWNYIGAPADGDSVLAVGAVNGASLYAPFSSNGPSSDGRVKPNVTAQGQGVYVAGPGGIFPANGTSFSGPVIAGASACLWQAMPAAGNMEILRAIEKSAHKYLSPDTLMGFGIPDYALALRILGKRDLPDMSADLAGNPYPNPAINNFRIDLVFGEPQTTWFRLYDISGKLVMEERIDFPVAGKGTFAFDGAGDLPAGVYLIRVEMKNESFLRKVVKLNP